MTVKNIQPLGNRVLVKRSLAKTTKGGIILPDSAKEKPKQGEVVAVGPGKMDEKGKFFADERPRGRSGPFSPYGGSEVKTDSRDEEYLIMSEDEILGVSSINHNIGDHDVKDVTIS